ncbi:efflux transporter outer membrane subunit [Pseudocolwellia sp. AS88]|uniref:efflux transporter outer membrane subunit n=1 Tax=Pseudocolwellia sp. AS88 TaxID=3063958 RepID=UPI0026E9A436|nr:efflux transporter outer membrane subunit [Pseudocolwellia sp. AS88]MDO7085575.1 efflux transporter outer membrane subunit [Pseudocolwellia sp. AS88]
MQSFKVINKVIILLFSLTAIAACTPLNTTLPDTDIPTNWQGPIADGASVWPERNWWVQFGSEELIDLIEDVEENNLDLAINTNNLRNAQLTMIDAGFDLWPTPSVTIGNMASIAGLGSSSTHGSNSFSLNGSLTYTNILNKYSEHQFALANYDSAQASAADTVLSTLGTTANTYFQLIFIRDQIKTAKQNLDSAQKIQRITQSKVDAGVTTAVDALQQELAVQQRLNTIENLKQSELASKSSIALLLGRTVQNFDLEVITLQDIVVPKVQPGIPSELLVRRPDIVEAEANLRSAKANVDLARLAFLPSISLTASSNSADSSLTNLLKNPNPISITANLIQTIFDNGSRFRNEERSRLALENSLLTYRKVVLKAFNDVDVALGNIRLLDSQAETANKDLERATEAFRISEVMYREGVQNFQTLLTTQQALYTVRDNYLQNKLARLNAIVAFYQTLGGGWEKELLVLE